MTPLAKDSPHSDSGAAANAVASEEASTRTRRLTEVSKRVLGEVTDELLQGARQVALESDRWFLATVRGVDKSAQRTKSVVGKLGRYVVDKSSKLTPDWLRKRTHRERIRDMLLREAKRSKVSLSGQQFEAFSEQIATLLELVLKGRVSISDIAFEQDERARPLDKDGVPPSASPCVARGSGKA